jgi:high-affinity nickel-transport protein
MSGLRRRLTWLFGALLAANLLAWIWALLLFRGDAMMLGTALLAWGLGLRHALDADHIAAIDNVTRRLMQAGQRPVGVGFWFAAGHSAVILAASAAVAVTAAALGRFEALRETGALIATTVSAMFLFTIAASNLAVLLSVWQTMRRGCDAMPAPPGLDPLFDGRGLLARLFRPIFRLVTRSWQMAPLGLLFGLGFDTATEVAILGLSASQAGAGSSPAVILVLPALFAAGMTLIDSADGVLMLGTYGWATVNPARRLRYNVVVTLLSALVAIVIGGVESAALIAERLGLDGGAWSLAAALGSRFNALGLALAAALLACWAVSAARQRRRREKATA